MDIKQKRLLAKKIRDGLLTTDSDCYRLKRLPKSMTINNIISVIEAMTDGSHDKWQEVYNTSLYENNGSEYCHLLAYINLRYSREIGR